MQVNKVKLLQVGPFVFDDQLMKLNRHLVHEGYEVCLKSQIKNRNLRFLDTILFLVFRRNKYNVVLIHTFAFRSFFLEYPSILIARFFNKRIIIYIHGGAFIDFYKKNTFFARKFLSKASRITTPSLFLKRELENFGFSVDVIPNTINSDNFYFSNSYKAPFSILWVRAFHEIYQPHLIIDIVNCLKDKFPNINVTMIGPDQGFLSEFIELIEKNSLEKFITIVGAIENRKLVEFYNNHKVFITTTKYESFGVAILEAARCKIPQVSTSVGEIPLMWKEGKEILLSESSGKGLADQIEKLFNSESLCCEIAEAAYNKSLDYDWRRVKILWMNLLNN